MVVKKRINYGFNGYRVPVIPRGPRSVRRRGSHKKTIEDHQICAFELLAAVAGKLLLESEGSGSGSGSGNAVEGNEPSDIHVNRKKRKKVKLRKPEYLDQCSCVESVSAAGHNSKTTSRGSHHAVCDTILESTSTILSYDVCKKVGHDVKLEIPEIQTAFVKLPGNLEGGSPNSGKSCDVYLDNAVGRHQEAEGSHYINGDLTTANTSSTKDPMEIYVNTHPLTHYNSSVQLTSCRDSIPSASFRRQRSNVKVGSRDDDEKSIRRNRPRSKMRAFIRSQRCTGYRRIRKSMASKYWKVAPKLMDSEFSHRDGGMKFVSRNRKVIHTSERGQREGPIRKRKVFDHGSAVVYDRQGSSESISNSPEKRMKGDKSGSIVNEGHQSSFHLRETHVKFCIKSFKVPELYIEVPETSTIGSLKRTVMEAVNAILEGGLDVGVLLRGKKVNDDNRTLLQTGISHSDNLDLLGFTFEPSPAIASPTLSPRDPPILLPCETHQLLTRLPTSPILDLGFSNASCDRPSTANVVDHVEGNHALVPFPTDVVTDATTPDSRALVTTPAMSIEALAVAPVTTKTRRSELVHRRTRRPFSLSEVEALVEAVEKLGTGRWRDVKLHAFENADHRTYVDLKDKWKTLVHTASIAPQQRRGQPVPQELLDRVLSAHAYWSQHQAKVQDQHQIEPFQIPDGNPMVTV